MKKLIALASLLALAPFCATADIEAFPLANGQTEAPYSARIVAIKAASSTSSGTISLKEVLSVATSTNATETVTNIVPKDATYRVADAYVAQTRVYTGTDGSVAWTNSTAQVVVGTVTNTVKVSTLYDGADIKWGPVTNVNASIRYRDIIAERTVTNITTRSYKTWSRTPYTNELYSGTLASGFLSAAVTNRFILGGSKLITDGTALSGGDAYLILER